MLDHEMHIWNFWMEAVNWVELTVEAMKTVTMVISFELHLEQISNFGEALFPSHLQGGFYVNCVPDSSWILCGEVFKVTWSEDLSDKCAAVIYVWNKELYINVRFNQTIRLIIFQNIQRHI